MHNHADGGSDLSVSFDAFTVTRWERAIGNEGFTESTRWRVQALTPWARDLMADRRCLGIATANRAVVLAGPDSGAEPTIQFGYGLGFERRKDALDFLRELEEAASKWRATPTTPIPDHVGEAIAAILNYDVPTERTDYEREGQPAGHVYEHLRTLETWARGEGE